MSSLTGAVEECTILYQGRAAGTDRAEAELSGPREPKDAGVTDACSRSSRSTVSKAKSHYSKQ